jgi:hypothetical protein
MAQLWVGRNLRELWEEWFSKIIDNSPGGKVVVESFAQKQALKQWVLDEKQALGGWVFVTREEECRRTGFLSQWEWIVLAKAWSSRSFWAGASSWSRELMGFLYAGYRAGELLLPLEWNVLTGRITDKVRNAGLRTTPPAWGKAAWVLGFSPVDCWGMTDPLGVGVIAEKETPEPGQTLALSEMERIYGGIEWCDSATPEGQIREVAGMVDLEAGIKELLNPSIRRIFWEGQGARAVLKSLDVELPGVLNFATEPSWISIEYLKTFKKAQEGRVSTRLDFLRQEAVVFPEKDRLENLLKMERELAKGWEKNGILEGADIGEALLPDAATIADYARLSSVYFPTQVETLAKRLKTIGPLMPPRISKELWLECLTIVAEPVSYYGGITVLPMDNARGLLDEETLTVVSESPKTESSSLTSGENIRAFNEIQYTSGKRPQKGYVELVERNHFSSWLAAGAQCAGCVCLHGVLPRRLKEKRNIRVRRSPPKISIVSQHADLVDKHSTRQDPQCAFGENDYAMEPPVVASCKRWEAIITTPELAWYDLLRLRPLWKAGGESPENLWVGNWVHEALKQDATLKGVDRFFMAMEGGEPSLTWKAARMRAWGIARGFAQVLAEVKTVVVEKAIEGTLELNGTPIPLTGRIDRVVKLSSDELCIVDFKTGSNAEGLAEEKIAEGDGLQLWLYGRLWKEEGPIVLCRLPVGKKLEAQAIISAEKLQAEFEMGEIAKTGIFGQRGNVWGRFAGEDRMPMGAFPVDKSWLKEKKRRKDE